LRLVGRITDRAASSAQPNSLASKFDAVRVTETTARDGDMGSDMHLTPIKSQSLSN